MRFAMLICGVDDETAEHAGETADHSGAPEATDDSMAEVWGWFQRWEAAGKIAYGGAELQSVRHARTIRAGASGERVITDGPYLELKEVIGGVVFLEAADMTEAVDIASSWPIRDSTSVEVRPVIEH